MSAYALITGVLFKPAEEKTSSKTGRPFVSATLKVGGESGDAAEFWQLTVFSQSAQSELLRLGTGDALSCQGKLKVELWQPRDGGEVRISRSLFADAVLPLRQPPRERRSKQAAASTPLLDQTPEKETAAGGPAFFSDDIPFGPAR
jgi:single-stranded DNA-binding protein